MLEIIAMSAALLQGGAQDIVAPAGMTDCRRIQITDDRTGSPEAGLICTDSSGRERILGAPELGGERSAASDNRRARDDRRRDARRTDVRASAPRAAEAPAMQPAVVQPSTARPIPTGDVRADLIADPTPRSYYGSMSWNNCNPHSEGKRIGEGMFAAMGALRSSVTEIKSAFTSAFRGGSGRSLLENLTPAEARRPPFADPLAVYAQAYQQAQEEMQRMYVGIGSGDGALDRYLIAEHSYRELSRCPAPPFVRSTRYINSDAILSRAIDLQDAVVERANLYSSLDASQLVSNEVTDFTLSPFLKASTRPSADALDALLGLRADYTNARHLSERRAIEQRQASEAQARQNAQNAATARARSPQGLIEVSAINAFAGTSRFSPATQMGLVQRDARSITVNIGGLPMEQYAIEVADSPQCADAGTNRLRCSYRLRMKFGSLGIFSNGDWVQRTDVFAVTPTSMRSASLDEWLASTYGTRSNSGAAACPNCSSDDLARRNEANRQLDAFERDWNSVGRD